MENNTPTNSEDLFTLGVLYVMFVGFMVAGAVCSYLFLFIQSLHIFG